jgi:hypothetical protein
MIDTLLEISQRYLVCEGKVEEVTLECAEIRQLSRKLLIKSEAELKRGCASNILL